MNMKTKLIFGLINSEPQSRLEEIDGLRVLNQTRNLMSDTVIATSLDMKEIVNYLSESKGVISSRLLTARNSFQVDPCCNVDDSLTFLDIAFGREGEFLEELRGISGVKAVMETNGIYGYVVIRDRFEAKSFEGYFRGKGIVRSSFTTSLESKLDLSMLDTNSEHEINGRNYLGQNKYENNYCNNSEFNRSYFEGCRRIAEDLVSQIRSMGSAIIYAPLRGAKPITDIVMDLLGKISNGSQLPRIVYPVTSSFVRYPVSLGLMAKNGISHASGRYANVLELNRLSPDLGEVQDFIYIDEIVSGGMMMGHCNEMVGQKKYHASDDTHNGILDEGILRDIVERGKLKVHVYGLADSQGRKFTEPNLKKLRKFESEGLMRFFYSPVDRLVTEDNRYVLGTHFLNFKRGPHCVPMIDKGKNYNEREQFIKDFKLYTPN